MRISSVLFFAIAIGVLTATVFVFDVFPHVFMAPWAFMATWILSVSVLLASYGPSGFMNAYRVASRDGSRAELRCALAFFKSARRLLVATPIICFILGAISILRNLVTVDHIGAPLSIILCSILYSAVGIVFAVEPFRASVEKKLSEFD